MAKGSICPYCSQHTYHHQGSYHHCSNCDCIGWGVTQPVVDVGRGRGNTCPWCKNLTLHDLAQIPNKFLVRRCSTCSYACVEPLE